MTNCRIQKSRRFPKGQGIVEYILVTALVALAAVAIFRVFRADLGTAYQRAGTALVQGVNEGVGEGPHE